MHILFTRVPKESFRGQKRIIQYDPMFRGKDIQYKKYITGSKE